MTKVMVAGVSVILGFGVMAVHGPSWFAVSYENESIAPLTTEYPEHTTATGTSETEMRVPDDRPVVQHVPLPESVKALYMSACVAGTPWFREELVELVETTELNSIVIDIKDYSGTVAFPVESETWQPAWQSATCGARDMKSFIADLHERGIFVIGRITVFQDPHFTSRRPDLAVLRSDGSVWQDYKGLGFIDVAAREFWDKIIELSVESYNLGFDELNYDYVRYPSDGDMRAAVYPHTRESEWPHNKPANLEAFFTYLHDAMTDEERFAAVRHEHTGREQSIPYISADTFGMTTTSYNDLSIGQIQERIAPYFDFTAPMVYPSHYPNGWHGLGNPNHHPYEVVYTAMRAGVERMQAETTPVDGFLHERIGTTTPPVYRKPAYGPERLRTWIQDFNYGGTYGPEEVRAQIQASYDAGVDSWMLWAPSNRYTREALHPPEGDTLPTPTDGEATGDAL